MVAGASVGEAGPILLAGAVTLFTTIVGWVAYTLKPKETKTEEQVAVVSATFADRKTIEALAAALEAVNVSLIETNRLMKAEAQHRHDQALIRDELRRRGILE